MCRWGIGKDEHLAGKSGMPATFSHMPKQKEESCEQLSSFCSELFSSNVCGVEWVMSIHTRPMRTPRIT